MSGMTRSSDGLDVRRRKLLFRCWHRGLREMDLILGRFADREIGTLSEGEVAELEHLTDLPDPQVLGWLTGETEVPQAQDTALFRRLRDFHESGDEKA